MTKIAKWWQRNQYCSFHGWFKGEECNKCNAEQNDGITINSSWYY